MYASREFDTQGLKFTHWSWYTLFEFLKNYHKKAQNISKIKSNFQKFLPHLYNVDKNCGIIFHPFQPIVKLLISWCLF